jgi:hypothetical protein
MANTGSLLTRSLTPLVIGCPRCGKPIAKPYVDGSQRCGRCGRQFSATFYDPPLDRGPVVLPSSHGTPCAKHARNMAIGSCSRCGAFMCELCRIDCDGQQVCPACFERLQTEGALPSLRSKITNYNSIALTLAVLGLIPCIGLILGPMAIWFAIRGKRQNARQGESISQATGVVAFILGVIGIISSIGFVLFLCGAFK